MRAGKLSGALLVGAALGLGRNDEEKRSCHDRRPGELSQLLNRVSVGPAGTHVSSAIHSPYGCSAPGPAPKQMIRVPGSSAQ